MLSHAPEVIVVVVDPGIEVGPLVYRALPEEAHVAPAAALYTLKVIDPVPPLLLRVTLAVSVIFVPIAYPGFVVHVDDQEPPTHVLR